MLNGILHENDAATILAWTFGLFGIVANIYVIFLTVRRYMLYHKTGKSGIIYTFLIANLAVADLCGSFYCVIIAGADYFYGRYHSDLYICELNKTCNNLTNIWLLNSMCSVARFVSIIAIYVPTFITLIIAIDRYRAIVYPYNSKRLTMAQIRRTTSISWLIVIIFAIIAIVKSWELQKLNEFDDFTNMCQYGNTTNQFFQIIAILTFVIIISCYLSTTVLYAKIITYMRQNRKNLAAIDKSCFKSKVNAEKHVTIVTSIIILTNMISWLPGLIIMIASYVDSPFTHTPIDQYLSLVGFLCLFINSALNPILYLIFTSTFCKRCC
ncbi:G-protein coupled receptor GRL101-like protein [Trichoplax sp. H2]|nr:G-protein coupled receptor GRL101-like protein [Trichoplax sp. H2]|eukprot:RDD36751.1 G-protein coupled receptor GRL101-like protein [Trichoplax sp. H2]